MKSPVIYCIEEYEYYIPYGIQTEYYDDVEFLIVFSCREGRVQLEYSLRKMVQACEKHEPGLYRYLKNLWADMEEFHQSQTRLIRALERDGFDVARLLYVFFDNYDLEHLTNWIKNYGKNQTWRTAEEIRKLISESDHELLQFGEFLGRNMDVTRKVYEAMKEVALGYLPTLNLLETELIRNLNTCLHNYALMMVDLAISEWQRLEFPEEYDDDGEDEDEDDDKARTLEGLRKFYLNYRSDHPVEGSENNPIFCVEIVDIVEEWELRGWNKVRVWYKLTCAEGEWYNDIDFQELIVEAMLYFPGIFADAMKYYRASSSPRPRGPAMLHGLRRKGHDLTPVLASYVASKRNFIPSLREEMRMNRRSPGRESFYESRRRWEKEERDPIRVEKFQLINYLRDGWVSEGIAVILRELPEFHIRIKNSFLDYFDYMLYHYYIDPINHIYDELERAFELKRVYKLKN